MGTSVGALEGGISALIIIQHWLRTSFYKWYILTFEQLKNPVNSSPRSTEV